MSEVSEFEAALTKADWMFDHNRTKLATKLSQEGVDSGAFSLILNYLCELDWMFVNNRVEGHPLGEYWRGGRRVLWHPCRADQS